MNQKFSLQVQKQRLFFSLKIKAAGSVFFRIRGVQNCLHQDGGEGGEGGEGDRGGRDCKK